MGCGKAISPNKSGLNGKMVKPSPIANVFRHIDPSWREYIVYVRRASAAGDEQMGKYLASFDALPRREQLTVMPEDVCSLSGTLPGELIGAVSRHYWEEKQGESVLIASVNHPRMVEATAFWGQMLADRGQDRELFFRLTGGLPDKKGASIVIHNATTQATFQTPNPSSAGANGFRTMDQRVIEMGRFLDAPDPDQAVPLFTKDTARVFPGDRPTED